MTNTEVEFSTLQSLAIAQKIFNGYETSILWPENLMKNILYENTNDGKKIKELEKDGWSICEVNCSTGFFTLSKYVGNNLSYHTNENHVMKDFLGEDKIVSDEIYEIIDNWASEHGITDDTSYLKGGLVRLSSPPDKFSTEARVVSINAKMFCYMPIAKDRLRLIG